MQTNFLYYGDNLDILRHYLPNATDAQLLAFEDTLHWGYRPIRCEVRSSPPGGTS